jgi:hypothetical protein
MLASRKVDKRNERGQILALESGELEAQVQTMICDKLLRKYNPFD